MRTWLARLFGGRMVEADDEPARIAPTVSAMTVRPVKRSSAVRSRARGSAEPGSDMLTLAVEERRGFDPYNSGGFHRDNAWNRVIPR